MIDIIDILYFKISAGKSCRNLLNLILLMNTVKHIMACKAMQFNDSISLNLKRNLSKFWVAL